MKQNKFLLMILVAAFAFIGFSSCSDDDDDISDIKLEKNEIQVEEKATTTVKITAGNGTYTVESANEEVAKATVKDKEITISGIAIGSTTITVKDKENKTATIKVDVISIAGEWKYAEAKIEVEGTDEDVVAEIKEAFDGASWKTVSLKADNKYEIKIGEGENAVTETGTYTYTEQVLTLTQTVEEGEEAEVKAIKVTEITKTTLKGECDRTTELKEEYPDAGITKVLESYSFTRE